jgi:hypothetical protein
MVGVGIAFEAFSGAFRPPFIHIAKRHQLHTVYAAEVVHVHRCDATTTDEADAHRTQQDHLQKRWV